MDRRGHRGGHRDRHPDGVDADDGRAAADRALPCLRSARGRAGGNGGVLPSGSPDRPRHDGGTGPRGAAGIPHLHRLPDGVRKAPGNPSHPADHLAVPERRQPVALRPRGGFRALPDRASGGGVAVSRLRGPVAALRRPPHHSHRGSGHADGHLPPELLRRAFGRRHGLRSRQQAPHRRGRARRILRLHPVGDHVPGDEPFLHQCPLRGLRASWGGGSGRGGAASGAQRDGRRGGGDPPGGRPRHRRSGVRHGGGAGAAQGPRTLRHPDEGRGGGEVRHSPRGGPHAGSHERAPRRSRHPVRPTGGDGGGELRLPPGGCGSRPRRERRHEPLGAS